MLCLSAAMPAAYSAHRLATFNIRYTGAATDTEGKDWSKRGPYCSKLITDYDLDVVGFQEITGTGRTYRNSVTGRTQLDDMKAWLPDYEVLEWDRDGTKKREYVAVAYKKDKYTLLDTGSFFISPTPEKFSYGWDTAIEEHPRVIGWVKLRDKKSGEEFIYAATHTNDGWSLDGPYGSQLIADKMKAIAGDTPVMIVADYNTSRSDRDRKGLKAYHAAFHDAALDVPADKNYSLPVSNPAITWTYNAFHPASDTSYKGSEIDFMFYRGMDILERHILSEQFAYNGVNYPVSDHFPMYVDVNIAPVSVKSLYVNCNAGGAGDGSKAAPYRTISDAVNAADIDDTIYVTAGDYAESVNPAYSVTIIGGYDDAFNNVVGISNLSGNNLDLPPVYAPGSIDLTLKNFRIHDYVSKKDIYDGAIHFNGADLNLENVVLENNEGADYGGALSIYNHTDSKYCDCTNLTLKNCTFRNNKAQYGAGMAVGLYDKLTIENCTFEGNSASMAGGAAYLTFGIPESNRIWFTNANVLIKQCAFANNSSARNGALYINDEMPNVKVTIVNTTFGGNLLNAGGGLANVIKTYGGAAIHAKLADCPANAPLTSVKDSKLYIGHVSIIGNHAYCTSPSNFNASAVNVTNGKVKLMNNIICANSTNGASALADVTISPADRLKTETGNVFTAAGTVNFSTSDRSNTASSESEGLSHISEMFDGKIIENKFYPQFTYNESYLTPYIFQNSSIFGDSDIATLSLLQRNLEKEFSLDIDGDGSSSSQIKIDQLGRDRNSKSMPGAVEFDLALSGITEVEASSDSNIILSKLDSNRIALVSSVALGAISVHDVNGVCIFKEYTEDTKAIIDLSVWGKGIFLVNIGKSNFKFII